MSERGWNVRGRRPSWSEDAMVWSGRGIVGPHGRNGVWMRCWVKEVVQQ